MNKVQMIISFLLLLLFALFVCLLSLLTWCILLVSRAAIQLREVIGLIDLKMEEKMKRKKKKRQKKM